MTKLADGAIVSRPARRVVLDPVRRKRIFERSAVRTWIAYILVLVAGAIKNDGFAEVGAVLLENLDTIVQLGVVALGLTASTSVTNKPEPRALGMLPPKESPRG